MKKLPLFGARLKFGQFYQTVKVIVKLSNYRMLHQLIRLQFPWFQPHAPSKFIIFQQEDHACWLFSNLFHRIRRSCLKVIIISMAHPLPLPPGALSPPKSSVTSAVMPHIMEKPSASPKKSQWQKGKLIGRGTFGSVYIGTNRYASICWNLLVVSCNFSVNTIIIISLFFFLGVLTGRLELHVQ